MYGLKPVPFIERQVIGQILRHSEMIVRLGPVIICKTEVIESPAGAQGSAEPSPSASRPSDSRNAVTPSTTVVDRRLAEESRVSGSGSAEREIDVVFAIGTSAVDAQRRAIHARKGE